MNIILAIAQVIASLAAVVALWIAWRTVEVGRQQLTEAARLQAEAERPRVLISTIYVRDSHRVDLIARNVGRSIAVRPRIRWFRAIERAEELPGYAIDTDTKLPNLMPDQQTDFFFDSAPARHARPDLPDDYEGELTYEDNSGKRFTERVWINAAPTRGLPYGPAGT